MSATSYDTKIQRIVQQFKEASVKGDVGLKKSTSNLFRKNSSKRALDVRSLNKVIAIDKKARTMTVEGMTTFEAAVEASLEQGLVPLVVPELKTITIGGAISGMAIESSSFKYGLMHESVVSMDVLTGSGEIITCTPEGAHSDLFYGMPNSYGTLGYVLKATIKVRPALPYVHLRHIRFHDSREYFKQLRQTCTTGTYDGETVDFIDGTVFRANKMFITLGVGSKKAPYTSDYTYKNIYYQSIREKAEDYLTIHDYLWRWDTDWFWCSKNMFADKWLVRRILGRRGLGSRTYSKIMRLEARYKIYQRLVHLFGHQQPTEDVIQDVEVPIAKAPEFLRQFIDTVGMSPVWVCPTKSVSKKWPYPLYPMQSGQLYINFGFWDTIPAHGEPSDAYYNKQVERIVGDLGGMKSLYSTSFYTRKQFEKIYNYPAYKKLKSAYDPKGRFKGLYEKCAER
jgi:FAD/FMN-containing dehydrogenase